MRRLPPIILGSLLSVCLLAGALAAQTGGGPPSPGILPEPLRTTAASLRDEALQGTRAYEIVRSLTTEVGPRPAGSPAFQRAIEWGLRTMRDLGFANVRSEPVKVPHWEPGVSTGEITSPWPQPMVLLPLGGSVGTPESGIDAEVVAVPSLQDLEKTDAEKVRGKIVFLDKRMARKRDGSGYGETVPGRGRGAAVAGKLGAVALLLRSVGTDNNRTPHTGAMRYEEGGPRIPAAALSNPDADTLEGELASGKPVRFHLFLGSRYLPDVDAANVIGEIPGREKPEEIVLLSCHLDSWFPGTGAIDDGAGCGIMIEAARRIGALPQKPRRTIRVILYANEEFGLSGGRAYAETHAAELPRHILAGESDFGSGRIWRASSRVAPEALPLFGELVKLLAPLNVERGDNEAEGGADLTPLAPAHVPVIGLSQDGTDYFDWHHTANDTLDKIDPKDMDQNVAAWVAVAYAAAEMPGNFGQAPEPRPRE
ncbi:MAG TPA: M20/M25/M40 family metallo-hydrolase [Thermoanaerobaculia bacterium]|nr:M20/M25/M40 family metallo-hydrolase [Thermoanaerobaculia bacterium]